MYVPVFVWLCVHAHTCAPVEDRSWCLVSFPTAQLLSFLNRVSYWTWALWFDWRGWPASPKDPPVSSLPDSETRSVGAISSFWFSFWRLEPCSLSLYGKHFTNRVDSTFISNANVMFDESRVIFVAFILCFLFLNAYKRQKVSLMLCSPTCFSFYYCVTLAISELFKVPWQM